MATKAFLFPLIGALLFALLAWSRQREQGSKVAWAPACAWGLGFALAYFGLKGNLAPWPAKEVGHWLFFSMLAAIPIASLHGKARSIPHFALGLALMAGFIWLSSAPLRKYDWEGALTWQMPLVLSAIAGVTLLLNSDLVRARPLGLQVPGAFALTMGSAAFVLGQSTGGSAHLAGGLACVGAVFCVVSLVRSKQQVTHGASLPFTLGLSGLLFTGVFFASTPWISAVLLLVAPQMIRCGWPIKQSAVRFVASVLACAALCGLAAYLSLVPEDPYGY